MSGRRWSGGGWNPPVAGLGPCTWEELVGGVLDSVVRKRLRIERKKAADAVAGGDDTDTWVCMDL